MSKAKKVNNIIDQIRNLQIARVSKNKILEIFQKIINEAIENNHSNEKIIEITEALYNKACFILPPCYDIIDSRGHYNIIKYLSEIEQKNKNGTNSQNVILSQYLKMISYDVVLEIDSYAKPNTTIDEFFFFTGQIKTIDKLLNYPINQLSENSRKENQEILNEKEKTLNAAITQENYKEASKLLIEIGGDRIINIFDLLNNNQKKLLIDSIMDEFAKIAKEINQLEGDRVTSLRDEKRPAEPDPRITGKVFLKRYLEENPAFYHKLSQSMEINNLTSDIIGSITNIPKDVARIISSYNPLYEEMAENIMHHQIPETSPIIKPRVFKYNIPALNLKPIVNQENSI
jgi:hypothetical protein